MPRGIQLIHKNPKDIQVQMSKTNAKGYANIAKQSKSHEITITPKTDAMINPNIYSHQNHP